MPHTHSGSDHQSYHLLSFKHVTAVSASTLTRHASLSESTTARTLLRQPSLTLSVAPAQHTLYYPY
eukprot:18767-Heterococcus_DN1.PRE.2